MSDPVKDRILLAARAEFAAQGEQAASVRVIASNAGVTAAMINYHFRSKRGLHEAVVAEAQARLLARITSALADDDDVAGAAAGAYFDFLAEDRELQRLLLREILDGGERNAAFAKRFVKPLRKLLRDRFGDDDEHLDRAVSLFGAIAGYFLYEPVLGELYGHDPLSPKRLAARRRHVISLARSLARPDKKEPRR